jgi:hypothetical protein
VIDRSELKPGDHAYDRLPWGLQAFIIFYLRANGFACTDDERELAASVIERRLLVAPIEYNALSVVLDHHLWREKLGHPSAH